MRQFALLFVLAAGVAVAAEEKKEKKPDFDGSWTVVSVEVGGKKIPEDDLKKVPALEGKNIDRKKDLLEFSDPK